MRDPAEVEVINDINGELVNMYRVVKYHLDEFVKQFRWALVSREMFGWLNVTPCETLTDIQRTARFYYLQKMSFGSRVSSRTFGIATTSGPKLNLLRLEEDLSQAHIRLSRTFIEHLAWQECVSKYDRDHALFYCDPPYYGTEGYGVEFGLDQYHQLAELAKSIEGNMIISVNDIPEMHEAFDGLTINTAEVFYAVGGGNKRAKRSELIIRNV
ncbi:restriction endonuclease subunit M [Nitrosomonas sp. PY1]|nr:restriction endonuclease subunit M [Nitrosomonas sp. PY1]